PERWRPKDRTPRGEALRMSDRLLASRRGGGAGGHLKKTNRVHATGRTTLRRYCWAGESEVLTGRAVELALEGDLTAMRLCLERILAPCRESTVKFALPPIESVADIAPA